MKTQKLLLSFIVKDDINYKKYKGIKITSYRLSQMQMTVSYAFLSDVFVLSNNNEIIQRSIDLFKKKNKGPTFEEYKMQNQFRPVKPQAPSRPSGPVSRPSYPMRPMPSVKSKEEDALEKSIKEAQRIIKGK